MHMRTCTFLLTPFFLAASLLLTSGPAQSEDLEINVTSRGGEALPGLVVYLTDASGHPIGADASDGPISIGQQDIQFTPRLSVVPVGAQIRFINNDKVAHHVFSFSDQAPDNLELVVEPGGQSEDYTFAKEGFSKIGCNIHDNMNAFIFAAPSNHVAVTATGGVASIKDIPPGDYRVWIWSSEQLQGPLADQPLSVTTGSGLVEIRVPTPKRRQTQRRSFDDY